MFMLYLDAGYRPGCMMLRIHHAEIFLESETYGDGFSLSPTGSILAYAGCYRSRPTTFTLTVFPNSNQKWDKNTYKKLG